jgi:hypothetical protein
VTLDEGDEDMFQIFTGYAVGTAIVVAISLAAVAPGRTAAHRHVSASPAGTASDPPHYYDYAPGQLNQEQLSPGQLGQRTNPTLPNPGPFGPPDPASCGGFHC